MLMPEKAGQSLEQDTRIQHELCTNGRSTVPDVDRTAPPTESSPKTNMYDSQQAVMRNCLQD